MTNKKQLEDMDTKERILFVARSLFADKGLHGVSIREIAKEADVNISAINYHFTNKEALFGETIVASILQTTNDVENLYQDGLSTNDLAIKIYYYFIENSDDLKSCFKLFLSNTEQHYTSSPDDNKIGPPGSLVIYKCLLDEVPNAGQDDLFWAVRTIFTHVIHKAILMSSNSGKVMEEKYSANHKTLEESISRLVRIIIQDIK